MKRTPLVLAGLLVLTSCAHEQLTLRLDIYNENPAVVELSEPEVRLYLHTLDTAETEGGQFALKRRDLAEQVFQLYLALQDLATTITKNPTPASVQATQARYLAEHQEWIAARESDLVKDVQMARSLLKEYLVWHNRQPQMGPPQLTGEAWSRKIKAALQQVSDDLKALGRAQDDNFERTFLANLPQMTTVLSDQNLQDFATHKEDFAKLRRQLQPLQKTAADLAADGSANMETISRQFADAIKAMDAQQMPTNLETATKALPAVPSLTAPVKDAVDQLEKPNDFNDVERVQDPTDPVWRVITSPTRERNWNMAFATNYFYAEGNSSVIVVRDTPISFRVQRGNNNPTALIQSQLQIARSVADAAIDIAGSAAGIKVQLPQGSAGSAGAGTNQAVNVSEMKAELDRNAALRNEAMKDLHSKLLALREDFEKNGADDKQRTNLLVRLRGLLGGDAPIFKPSESTNAPTSTH